MRGQGKGPGHWMRSMPAKPPSESKPSARARSSSARMSCRRLTVSAAQLHSCTAATGAGTGRVRSVRLEHLHGLLLQEAVHH